KYLLGISEDITERKQAEEALGSSKAELSESMRIARLASWEYDVLNDVFTFNDQFYALMRTSAQREGGYTMPSAPYAQRFVHPDDAPLVGVEIQKALEATDPNFSSQLDHRVIFGDGTLGYVTVRFRIEKDDQGRTIRTYGANQDITERKQTEETLAKRAAELEEARNSLDAVIESLPIMLFMKDAEDLRMVRWNKAGADTIGLPAEALVGKTDYDFFPKEEAEFFRAKDREVLENGKLLDIPEEPIQTTHRGLRYLHTRKVPIYGADGKPKFLLGISEDITERKLSEEILAKRAHEMAAVAQVSTDAASVLDPNELLQKVVDLTKISFNLYHAHIYLLNEAEGVLVLTAGAGAIGRRMVADGRRIPIAQAQSLVARAARTRKSVMVNEVTQDPGFLPHPLLPNTRSEMAIPMIVGNRALGVLDVQSDIVDRFTNEDTQIQTTLAAQIAVALQNARQYDQTQAAFKELETLNRRLTRESWRDYVSAQQTSRLGYTYDLNQIKRIENGETVIEGNGAAIEHALTIHGETIGRLAIAEAEQANADAAEIVAAVAEQLSAHLENLRLTEQAEAARHTSELQAANLARLAQIANTLSQAKTDEEILLAAVNAADKANLLAVTLCYIEGLEGGRPASTRVMAMWAGDDIVKDSPFLNQVFDLRQYASSENWIKNPHDALLVEDLLNNPEVDDQTRALFSRGGGGSMATVPLFSGGAWQGILFFTWAGPREFTPEDHFLLPAINEPVAAAVAARRAYIAEEAARRQSEQRATELEAIAKVSAAAASILDSNLLLQTVVDLTKADLDLYHAHIYILDEPGNSLQLAAGADEVGRKMAAASFAIPVNRPHSLVARAARTRKGVIANDVLEEPDFLPNPYLPNTRSELAVPMIVGDKLIGVFDVQADTVNRFTEADIVLKTTLAEQVAVALQNTRLFAEQASTLERLRELDQLKSSFLANMSHELRTPLNSILGFAQVMIEGIDGEITTQMENDLQVIQKNGQHLLNLISDILDMAKIEAGKMSLNTEIFDLREVMEEVVEITNPMARAKSISVALNASVQQTLDIYADRMRLRQVMINIVNNAIKFTERGYIDISATREGSVIRVSVRDTGIGVLPSHLNKIFEEFSQV
ncbi:MAG TPA: GAF domain-containing protein, partial [Anaerolineales bacterium]|nr:GAF domain-containing protein [Anaerolineales bacterium]